MLVFVYSYSRTIITVLDFLPRTTNNLARTIDYLFRDLFVQDIRKSLNFIL